MACHIFCVKSEAPRASARGICGKAKRNSAEANLAFRRPQLGLLQGTLQSPFAIPPRASARGILAKASEDSTKSEETEISL